MDSAPPMNVPLALAALYSRAAKELGRMRGVEVVGTELVGGWARLGSLLDALLRATFCVMCLDTGYAIDPTFQRLSGHPSWVVSNGTAGQFAHVLPLLARELTSHDAQRRAVVEAARDPRSALRRAIEVRNAMVHGNPLPSMPELQALLAELVAWCAARA